MRTRNINSLVIAVALLLVSGLNLAAQNKVIRLYDGPAPGSEKWTHTERESRSERGSVRAWNVVNPTLTVFPADSATANGTALIICPGGAFFQLSMDSEGADVARWLNT